MQQLIHLLKTSPFARFALGAAFAVLVIVIYFSLNSSSTTPTPTRLPPTSPRPEIANLDTSTLNTAREYRSTAVRDALPITVKGFQTSPGIETELYLYTLPGDPPEAVRFEIFGLSYLNPSSDPATNPNVTAFKESFEHGLKLLRTESVDPSKLIFIYSDINYIRETATSWVSELGLL